MIIKIRLQRVSYNVLDCAVFASPQHIADDNDCFACLRSIGQNNIILSNKLHRTLAYLHSCDITWFYN